MRISRLAPAVGLIACLACGGGNTSPSARIPDYSGGWSGTYTVSGCNQSGQIALAPRPSPGASTRPSVAPRLSPPRRASRLAI